MPQYKTDFGSVICTAILLLGTTAAVNAQVVPDRTTNTRVTGSCTSLCTIRDGITVGPNLFHSFDQFSIPRRGGVAFANASGIENIFSRVTGSLPSNIDGLLRAGGSANVFLLNPNGIVFGPNARLDVRGSFLASTASAIGFANGEQYSTDLAQPLPTGLLNVNPNALFFNRQVAQPITVRTAPSGLGVPVSQNLFLIGGDVRFEGGAIRSPGSRVAIGSVAGLGIVRLDEVDGDGGWRLNIPPEVPRADVYLNNNSTILVVDNRVTQGGGIAITARDLVLRDRSNLITGVFLESGSTNAQAGDITIDAARNTELVNNSSISNIVAFDANGNAGNVVITTSALSLRGLSILNSGAYGQGNSGDIVINARESVTLDNSSVFSPRGRNGMGQGGDIHISTGSLLLRNQSRLAAFTFGRGDAGDIIINARGHVTMDDSSASISLGEGGVGRGGSLRIFTGSLFLTNNSVLIAETNGQGNAGNIMIDARNKVSLVQGSNAFSSVLSEGVGQGGTIQITAGSLFLASGAQLVATTSGLGNAGNILLNIRGQVRLDSSSGATSIRTSVNENAIGQGGVIRISTGSLFITNGSELLASSNGRGNAGSVTINARDRVSLSGTRSAGRFISVISSSLEPEAIGQAGDINIITNFLNLTDAAQIGSNSSGHGNAGSININARNSIFLDGGSGALTNVNENAIGHSGNIRISTGSLFMANGSQLVVSNDGRGNAGNVIVNARDHVSLNGAGIDRSFKSGISSRLGQGAIGKAGNINITANSLTLADGARLTTATAGRGNAGNVIIDTQDQVLLSGNSAIFSSVNANAVGQGGNIRITTGSLFVTNGSQLITSSEGRGNAGSVIISARDRVLVSDRSSNRRLRTSIFSNVLQGAIGRGGNITISANSLTLSDGAQISTSTSGRGDAGSLDVNARNQVLLEDSAAFSRVNRGAIGQGGDIHITTGSLFLANGSQLITSAEGQGNAGSVIISVRNHVSFSGISSNGRLRSGILSDVAQGSIGQGGNINIDAGSLALTDRALLTSGTSDRGGAGSVVVNVRDRITLNNGSSLLADTAPNSAGQGGDIQITAGELFGQNRAQISVGSQGTGTAGDIVVNAQNLVLNDQSRVLAETNSTRGGNVSLSVDDLLLLRNNSLISTTAGNSRAGGDGGNIRINGNFLIAVPSENSDIRANAFRGNGGNVAITTQGIFGISPQATETPFSDITASSQLGLPGTIRIDQPDVQPTQGEAELPNTFAAPPVAQGCNATSATSSFVNTGRGGIPQNPTDSLTADAVWQDLEPFSPSSLSHSSNQTTATAPPSTAQTITEAQGWSRRSDGTIVLVAQAQHPTPHFTGFETNSTCRI